MMYSLQGGDTEGARDIFRAISQETKLRRPPVPGEKVARHSWDSRNAARMTRARARALKSAVCQAARVVPLIENTARNVVRASGRTTRRRANRRRCCNRLPREKIIINAAPASSSCEETSSPGSKGHAAQTARSVKILAGLFCKPHPPSGRGIPHRTSQ